MKSKLKYWFSNTQTYILLIVIAYVVIVSAVNPAFFTAESLFDLLQSSAGVMIVALGVMLVIVSGGIDVSFTVIAVFGAYSAARFMQVTGIDNIIVAFAIAIVIGAALGAVNALLIHRFKLPVFVVTLGTQSMFTGLMATIVGTVSINPSQCPRSLVDFGALKIFTVTGGERDAIWAFYFCSARDPAYHPYMVYTAPYHDWTRYRSTGELGNFRHPRGF